MLVKQVLLVEVCSSLQPVVPENPRASGKPASQIQDQTMNQLVRLTPAKENEPNKFGFPIGSKLDGSQHGN